MHVESLDLNLLRVLHALLEERHVTRAAARLGLSQAATSHALARLRVAFGDRLLVRVGREMHFTPEAERLAPVVEHLMSTVRHDLVRPTFDPASSTLNLTVAMPNFLAGRLMPDLIATAGHEAPGVTLGMYDVVRDSPDIFVGGTIDVALLPQRMLTVPAASEYVATIEWHGLAAADNDAVHDDLTLEEFSEMPHLVIDHAVVHATLDELLRGLGLERRRKVRLNTELLATAVLPGTDLVYIGSRQRAIDSQLRSFRLPVDLPGVDYCMAWPERYTEDPARQWLRAHVRRLARHLNT